MTEYADKTEITIPRDALGKIIEGIEEDTKTTPGDATE